MKSKEPKIREYSVIVKGILGTKEVLATSPIDAIYKLFDITSKDLIIKATKFESSANVSVELVKGLRKTKNYYTINFEADDVNNTAELRMRDIVKRRNIVGIFTKEYSIMQYNEEKHIIRIKKLNSSDSIIFEFNAINTGANVTYQTKEKVVKAYFDYDDIMGIRTWYITL